MSRKVLLIADDDEMNRTVIRRFLKNSFDIIEAEDGVRVLEILETNHVDLLLLDILMPHMDGLEVLTELRGKPARKYMGILVASSTKEKTEREALSLGADDVVAKPYDPIVIRKRLENIMMVKELQEQQDVLGEQNHVEMMLQKQNEHLTEQVELCADKLHRIADIIEQSLENEKLLAELSEDIHIEANKLVGIFTENS